MRTRLPAVLTLATIASLTAGTARAQDRTSASVAGGYSFLSELQTPGVTHDYPAGWFVTYETPRLLSRLSVAAEVTGSQRRNDVDETQRLLAFLAGPRIAVLRLGPARLSAVVLIGTERFSEPGFTESGVAVEPGATVDISVFGRVGARIGAGYRLVQATGETLKEVRVSAGTVVRLGRD